MKRKGRKESEKLGGNVVIYRPEDKILEGSGCKANIGEARLDGRRPALTACALIVEHWMLGGAFRKTLERKKDSFQEHNDLFVSCFD